MAAGALNVFRLAGDAVHLLSIGILWNKIQTARSCAGISLKSQLLYAAVYITRYLDLLSLPKMRLLSVYNAAMKVFFVGSQLAVVYVMRFKYRATYNKHTDLFRVEFLVVPSVFFAWLFTDASLHDGLFFFLREYLWTFSIILESVAIFPQLFLLQRTGEAETITSHYLFCLGMYRVLYILNWTYRAIFARAPEPIVVLAGLLQSALYADFFYEYYKKVICYQIFKLPK
ncbi:MAG: ER lumen protein retaining receptor [Amphiamblys sp. WSBS2006]|nr:MAG: ER lumen protein retaining receptor [Amphiamblys sp. WSBS2006]